jgi:hypothetical protein
MSIQQQLMEGQLQEMAATRKDAEAQQRAFLEVINPEMTPYDANGKWLKPGEPGVTGWMVSPGWKNVGLTLAQHARLGFGLKWYPQDGTESDEQMIELCPSGPPLDDHPEFDGFTLAPGDHNGKIFPAKELPLAVAAAAQRNRMLIMIIVNAKCQDAFQDSPLRHSYYCIGIFVNDSKQSAFSFVNLKQGSD